MNRGFPMRARCEAPVEYETVEHTADLGFQVEGRDLAELLARAAVALADLEFDPAPVEKRLKREVHLIAADPETLLIRWLNELIVLREIEDFLWREVEVEVAAGGRLSATLSGERFDETRHFPRLGLKAATYHQLRVEQRADTVRARVIFDV